MGMVRRRTRRRTMMVAWGMAYAAGRNRPPQEEPLQDEAAYGEPPPGVPKTPIGLLTRISRSPSGSCLTPGATACAT